MSENQYYSAQLSDEFAFATNGIFFVESSNAVIAYSLVLDNFHNLVSFYVLPNAASLEGVTSSLSGNIFSVITEGFSAAVLRYYW